MPLQAGWVEKTKEDGSVYWFNESQALTTQTRPTRPVVPPPPPPPPSTLKREGPDGKGKSNKRRRDDSPSMERVNRKMSTMEVGRKSTPAQTHGISPFWSYCFRCSSSDHQESGCTISNAAAIVTLPLFAFDFPEDVQSHFGRDVGSIAEWPQTNWGLLHHLRVRRATLLGASNFVVTRDGIIECLAKLVHQHCRYNEYEMFMALAGESCNLSSQMLKKLVKVLGRAVEHAVQRLKEVYEKLKKFPHIMGDALMIQAFADDADARDSALPETELKLLKSEIGRIHKFYLLKLKALDHRINMLALDFSTSKLLVRAVRFLRDLMLQIDQAAAMHETMHMLVVPSLPLDGDIVQRLGEMVIWSQAQPPPHGPANK